MSANARRDARLNGFWRVRYLATVLLGIGSMFSYAQPASAENHVIAFFMNVDLSDSMGVWNYYTCHFYFEGEIRMKDGDPPFTVYFPYERCEGRARIYLTFRIAEYGNLRIEAATYSYGHKECGFITPCGHQWVGNTVNAVFPKNTETYDWRFGYPPSNRFVTTTVDGHLRVVHYIAP